METYVVLYCGLFSIVRHVCVESNGNVITVKVSFQDRDYSESRKERIIKYIDEYIDSHMCKFINDEVVTFNIEECDIDNIRAGVIVDGFIVSKNKFKKIYQGAEDYNKKYRWSAYRCGECLNEFGTGRGRVGWCVEKKKHTVSNGTCHNFSHCKRVS